MLRLIIVLILFLCSLLIFFRAPTNFLWYVSIVITEFSWLFCCVVPVLLFWRFGDPRLFMVTNILAIITFIFFTIPIVNAYSVGRTLRGELTAAFGILPGTTIGTPFSLTKLITGINTKALPYKTYTYDTSKALTLDFYPSTKAGKLPCVLIVHGGSWSGGDSQQLPELNSVLAKAGYNVAAIRYRLAPQHHFPAPVEDLQQAISYLRSNATELQIDTNNFVLLGRSAGGQIVLTAAYTLKDAGVKGVISFYGPADMVWGYHNPTNPLVLNSRKVMADYLGGSYEEVPAQYVNSSATETWQINPVPSLLIHGKIDPLVSHIHTERLSRKLSGVKHYELYLPWATHGFDWTLNGPGGQLSTFAVLHFLQRVVDNK